MVVLVAMPHHVSPNLHLESWDELMHFAQVFYITCELQIGSPTPVRKKKVIIEIVYQPSFIYTLTLGEGKAKKNQG